MTTAKELLEVDDLKREVVPVKQWKTELTIQELGLQESMQAYEGLSMDDDGSVTLTYKEIAQLVAYGVIDPKTGDRIFSDADVPKLARKNRDVLKMLYHKIVALNGSVEDEAKN